MPFTPEQRAKALATRMANKAKRAGKSDDKLAAALEKVAELEKKLGISEEKRTKAEQDAMDLASSQSNMLQPAGMEEVPTGKKMKIKVFKEWKTVGYKDNGDEINRPVFMTKEVPTFFYKVDMAPVGGNFLTINGMQFYHGATYELDIDTLRTVKDMCFKTWKHDRDIHGSDESFYRGTHRDFDPRNTLSARV